MQPQLTQTQVNTQYLLGRGKAGSRSFGINGACYLQGLSRPTRPDGFRVVLSKFKIESSPNQFFLQT